jgi:hypothetical protein
MNPSVSQDTKGLESTSVSPDTKVLGKSARRGGSSEHSVQPKSARRLYTKKAPFSK